MIFKERKIMYSAENVFAKPLQRRPNESDISFAQREIKHRADALHSEAMKNGMKHQYVRPENRKGYLEFLDGYTHPKKAREMQLKKESMQK